MLGWAGRGGESEDGGPKRERKDGGSASKELIAGAIVASVAVTKLSLCHVALMILLLVDPFDDVLVAMY